MSVTPSPIGGFAGQFFDNNGQPLSGGKIYTYAAGTTTPQATYTSALGITPHSNPIILDSAGRVPGGEIWLTDGLIYKFVIETSLAVLIGTYDNITGVNSNFVNYTVQEEVITATAGQTVFNLTTINYTPGTNSLSVYIDGVNQYVGDSYLETDSDTVTFTAGLHVGAEVKFTTAVQTTTGAVDASIVGYDPPFANSVATTVEDKLAQYVSVDDFGAVGNGVTDDAAAIQLALNSTAKTITFTQGKTYITNGGLLLSRAGVKIVATGATIRLKASASDLGLLDITANDCEVIGGEWDGNKANGNTGTWGAAQFNSYAVNMAADRCTVRDARVKDFWGIGIKGFGNNLSVLNSRITGTQTYGVFFDGSNSVSHSGNSAIGNYIDMSAGEVVAAANQGQGILFTAGSGQAQTGYTLANNYVVGPTANVTDQAINLAVRGNSGVVSGNITNYGAMGFSEGGDDCQITGNSFLQLRGTVRIGIEPSGRFNATANTITEAYIAIDCTSTTATYDGSVVSGNTLRAITGGSLSAGVRLQPDAALSAQNVSVSGNTVTTTNCVVYATRDCTGLNVCGNACVGPGIGAGTAVFLDGPEAAAHCSVTGNTFNSFATPLGVGAGAPLTVTDLYASNNNYINCGNRATWVASGSATIGVRACVLGTEYGRLDVYDVSLNVFTLRSTSFNNPEGFLTAGIGSIHVSLNSAGGIYFKSTGTGNTGWVAL